VVRTPDTWGRTKEARVHRPAICPCRGATQGPRHWRRFFSPFAREKQRLDSRLSQVAPWTLHDIRHHVRTMLSRVASPDIAERCVGHRLQGIRKVYDHYTYMPEMREALEALAKVICNWEAPSGASSH
jgi:hypothetical protein